MSPGTKRPETRPSAVGPAPVAIAAPDAGAGTAQQRARRAAQRRWRLKALACLRRKTR